MAMERYDELAKRIAGLPDDNPVKQVFVPRSDAELRALLLGGSARFVRAMAACGVSRKFLNKQARACCDSAGFPFSAG